MWYFFSASLNRSPVKRLFCFPVYMSRRAQNLKNRNRGSRVYYRQIFLMKTASDVRSLEEVIIFRPKVDGFDLVGPRVLTHRKKQLLLTVCKHDDKPILRSQKMFRLVQGLRDFHDAPNVTINDLTCGIR